MTATTEPLSATRTGAGADRAYQLLRTMFAVALAPRFGALLVAAWLGGIIVNLVSMGAYYDVALRDVGLLVGALALAALAFDRHAAKA
jgi:hypothetical protein